MRSSVFLLLQILNVMSFSFVLAQNQNTQDQNFQNKIAQNQIKDKDQYEAPDEFSQFDNSGPTKKSDSSSTASPSNPSLNTQQSVIPPVHIMDVSPTDSMAKDQPLPTLKSQPFVPAENKITESPKIQKPKMKAYVSGQDINQSERDEPNFKYERRLHEIYKKYNYQPTSEEHWSGVLGSRSSEVYKVQKGDTLWDLSQTLFGDPNYWPKVWSLNKDSILNPHELDAKMAIRFYPGSAQEAPALGLLTQNQVDSEYVPAEIPVVEGSVLKKREEPIRLLPTAKIPESLPIYRLGQVHKPKVEFIESPGDLPPPISSTYLQYKVVDQFPRGDGYIKETETGLSSAAEFQYCFVQMDQAPSQKLYTVIKEKRKIEGASQVEIQGLIEIIERVNDRQNLYKALVKKQISLVSVGAVVVPGSLPKYDLSLKPVSKPSAPLKIVGGSDISGNRVLGKNSYVFLRGGRAQSLTVGEVLPVFQNQQERNSATQVEYLSDVIGSIKLIDVSESYSTGMIVKSNQTIRPGDWVGVNGVTYPLRPSEANPLTTSKNSAKTEFEEGLLDLDSEEADPRNSGSSLTKPDSGVSSQDSDLQLE